MKKVIIVLLTASTLISCSTRERKVSSNLKRVRVYELKNGYKQSVVHLRYIDTMYRSGDTVNLNQTIVIID